MADVYDKEKRSAMMRNIKGKGNKSTELALIAIFREQGLNGWRRGYPVKGHPDFVFLKERIAVFVDGCFWHGHDCRNTKPKDNEDFWSKKISANVERDKTITMIFENRGWTVLRIWECELKKKNRAALIKKLSVLKDCGA
ncbi:DNA mismatch repair protein Vsr [Desulfosporosinus sp. Tol-M]|nr:DNA mismatch repair protein Vsr [Desulfosporosinus sp. Tol-M]